MTALIHPSQARLVETLAQGQIVGESGPLRRLDTHMSHVFLGEARAYKLKRALRHPFTDLSTLERRRLACLAELRLNRRLAPTLYEAVWSAHAAANGSIILNGAGEVIDYLVVMRRFADGALLDEIARAGNLKEAQVLEAIDLVARFHAGLPPHFEAGRAIDYHTLVTGLRATETAGAAALGLSPASEPLFSALAHAVDHQAPLIEARRRDGWVREGHGDLHLRNICIFEGKVTPFDALEFDPALTTTDVLYDLAFLLMDLQFRGLANLADIARDRYWSLTGQPAAATSLLNVFVALRATVRMAVTVEAGDLPTAARYRALALSLLTPAPRQARRLRVGRA